MFYTEAELKANNDEASFSFRPNTIGHTSNIHLPIRINTRCCKLILKLKKNKRPNRIVRFLAVCTSLTPYNSPSTIWPVQKCDPSWSIHQNSNSEFSI